MTDQPDRIVGEPPVYEGQGVMIWVINHTDDPTKATVQWAMIGDATGPQSVSA